MSREAPTLTGPVGAARQPSRRIGVGFACSTRMACMLGVWLLLCSGLAAAPSGQGALAISGHPFVRHYSFEEMGNLSRDTNLAFDAIGRLVAIDNGSYFVLNDTTWLDLTDKEAESAGIQNVTCDRDGQSYFGSLGSWGIVSFSPEGKIHPQALVPATCPRWALTSNFTQIFCTEEGVYFASTAGVVFLDRKSRRQVFFEYEWYGRTFALGGNVYVSYFSKGIHRVDPRSGSLVKVLDQENEMVDHMTALQSGELLAASPSGHFFIFDGSKIRPWLNAELEERYKGRVSALQCLSDGNVAIAINGRGLFVVSVDGRLLSSLTSSEFLRITRLATHEPGVLWMRTENGVAKVLHDNPVTVFNQSIGLPVFWPQVVRCEDRILVASEGRLYESAGTATDSPSRFHPVDGQPESDTWGIAASGDDLLVANTYGVFVRGVDGVFKMVLENFYASRLALVRPDLCIVVGQYSISALRRVDGRWTECVPRVEGHGYPSIVHATRNAAWIELGVNRVCRVSVEGGRIFTRIFEDFPWKIQHWVNLSVLGNIVVMAGPGEGYLFFNDDEGRFCDAPALKSFLDGVPTQVARMALDAEGSLWCSHDKGVVMARNENGTYRLDRASFEVINDRFPIIQPEPDGSVWVRSGESLYLIDPRRIAAPQPNRKPVLVSAEDAVTRRELVSLAGPKEILEKLAYSENSLNLRFFSGSYGARRSPLYEYRWDRGTQGWTTLESGSLLSLPRLGEGSYRLEVRQTGELGAASEPLEIPIRIAAPWYRTWYAYLAYALAASASVYGLLAWAIRFTRIRNQMLENVVKERTEELRTTMEKLNEETKNAATLAERNRLAGEIHDSIEQGFSGLILQLDTTAKLGGCPPEVRSGLALARSMVAFSRNEVRHAVWDLHSPLLDSGDLPAALAAIVSQLAPQSLQARVTVDGPVRRLSPTFDHHLLRIAQEAIANAVKHAGAGNLEIRLHYSPAEVHLSIQDDGRGFDASRLSGSGFDHFGLRSLRGRASKIGGSLRIDSQPGKGTLIEVSAPLVIDHA